MNDARTSGRYEIQREILDQTDVLYELSGSKWEVNLKSWGFAARAADSHSQWIRSFNFNCNFIKIRLNIYTTCAMLQVQIILQF